ncbi:MAG: type II secretion system F family protein [Acidimicrobiia bacterium]
MPVAAVVGAVALVTDRRAVIITAACGALLWQPLLMAGFVATAFLGQRLWRLRRRRSAERAISDELILFGELISLGLSAGLPFLGAVSLASSEMSGEVASEVRAVMRASQLSGASVALAAAPGHTAPLFRLVARAVATGAPVGPGVAGFVLDARRERQATRIAAAKRLPVRLLVPLTLLILPGFVVLTLGPALLSGVERLQL